MKDITQMNDNISNKFETSAFGSIDRMQGNFQKSAIEFKQGKLEAKEHAEN